MSKSFTLFLLVILLTACTARFNPAPPATPTPSPTRLAARLPTLTRSLTPLPPATLTSSPRPTQTATRAATRTRLPTLSPTPSATDLPEGYYSSDAGFALIIPDEYSITEDTVSYEDGATGKLTLELSRRNLNLYLVVAPVDASCDIAVVVEQYRTGLAADYSIISAEVQGEARLARGVLAQRGLVRVSVGFEQVDFEIYVAGIGNRCLNLFIVGPVDSITRERSQLDGILSSIEIYPPLLYGIRQDQAIFLDGYDPSEQDLDPARATGGAAGYVGLLYSGLVRLTPQLQLEPDLAEKWEISPTGLVYTFTLRADLFFWDGTALTAQAVKDSWERAADPDLGSTTVRAYLGDILGVADKLERQAETIAGVQVIDERTLVVTLDAPKTYFLAKLTYPTSYVVDVAAIQDNEEEWMFTPNPSGPFRIKEYTKGEALIFEPNDLYHTKPRISRVIYRLNLYGNPVGIFEAGEIDWTEVPLSSVRVLQEASHPLHPYLQSISKMCTTFVSFSNSLPPTDDPQVRKALVMAIDRDRLVHQFYEDLAPRADTLLPPAMPGHSTDYGVAGYDPVAARAALQASRYAQDMPVLKALVYGRAGQRNSILEALLSAWQQELGLQFAVVYLDPEVLVDADNQPRVNLVESGWCADYPDPQNFLDVKFYSRSSFNNSGYRNDEVDRLLEQAGVELAVSRRLQLYQQVEKFLLDDGALLPLWYDTTFVLVNPALQGFTLSPIDVPLLHLLTK